MHFMIFANYNQGLAPQRPADAFAAFEENERGQLKLGHKADLTILSDDPVALAETAPDKIMSLKVLDTYVNGRKVTPLPLASQN